MMLNSFQQKGIEDRRWRIAKYLDTAAKLKDADGLTDAKEPAEITFLNSGLSEARPDAADGKVLISSLAKS